MMSALVSHQGFTVATAPSLQDARRQLALQPPDLVFLDLRLPDGSGMDLFETKDLLAASEVVLITAHASLDTSVQALRLGAADYLVKPITAPQLASVLKRYVQPRVLQDEMSQLDAQWARTGQFALLLGRSPPMRRVVEQIKRVASTSISVFITGESGTGKELVAQSVHSLSRRRSAPFLAVNCGAIAPNLMESEVFGHEKGSFTGADAQHQGFFERAHGGTLFLDEITEMPPELQVKLLRVLETRSYMRVGSTRSRDADVRVIAATNRQPELAVAEGRLREDLMYRLNVFPIHMPPLRDRCEDVPILARHFLATIAQQEGRRKQFTPEALDALSAFRWPGNVRELRNVVQRAYVMTEDDRISDEWLPRNSGLPLRPRSAAAGRPSEREASTSDAEITLPIGIPLAEVERRMILAALAHFDRNKERTAAALGISIKTLYNRLKDYERQAASEGDLEADPPVTAPQELDS
jgi:DNA-binding NtrC family response regulator